MANQWVDTKGKYLPGSGKTTDYMVTLTDLRKAFMACATQEDIQAVYNRLLDLCLISYETVGKRQQVLAAIKLYLDHVKGLPATTALIAKQEIKHNVSHDYTKANPDALDQIEKLLLQHSGEEVEIDKTAD